MTGTNSPLKVGLLGRGIAASSSPAIHETEAACLDLALTYQLFDFDLLGLADDALSGKLNQLLDGGFSGVNITHPFKQAVIPLLDDIDPTAASLGAVNTVTFRDGRMIGSNTDWIGFQFMLDVALPDEPRDIVAQIGSGGAGSATAFALLASGTRELRIHDASATRIEALEQRLRSAFPEATIIACASAAGAIDGACGVVQSTPVGMAQHPGMPFDPALLDEDQWLADVIYFPRETELLKAARQRGMATADGAPMVVGQAAEAFRQFTGVEPDRDRMLAALTGQQRSAA
ncbi:shikimate dehydrogenase [Aurantiacibacter rhizosphaerae]|uniref:Shikimate dehydrogenase n=1 Tax=Aurantiacibacter rhizosphaerae TaxID=2691582 RepID=A0A844XCM4_9SPHN|nr:shikimate dehydrogenase [Aurantiacibacter rhizosphaerae]MWV28187.1 shikimate dehydrogenase [Aurantiacibacter rhizosphaerae]